MTWLMMQADGRWHSQVHKAFKYMQKMAAAEVVDTRYNVRVKRAGSTEWQRGVYLRDPLDTAAAPSFTVEVMPQLHEVCAWCAPALPLPAGIWQDPRVQMVLDAGHTKDGVVQLFSEEIACFESLLQEGCSSLSWC